MRGVFGTGVPNGDAATGVSGGGGSIPPDVRRRDFDDGENDDDEDGDTAESGRTCMPAALARDANDAIHGDECRCSGGADSDVRAAAAVSASTVCDGGGGDADCDIVRGAVSLLLFLPLPPSKCKPPCISPPSRERSNGAGIVCERREAGAGAVAGVDVVLAETGRNGDEDTAAAPDGPDVSVHACSGVEDDTVAAVARKLTWRGLTNCGCNGSSTCDTGARKYAATRLGE
jgi:hypothetical protein